jgi:hypothetical protein
MNIPVQPRELVCFKHIFKKKKKARHWWLTPVIPLLRRQRSGGSLVEASLGK